MALSVLDADVPLRILLMFCAGLPPWQEAQLAAYRLLPLSADALAAGAAAGAGAGAGDERRAEDRHPEDAEEESPADLRGAPPAEEGVAEGGEPGTEH